MGSKEIVADSHLAYLLLGVPLIIAVAVLSFTRWFIQKWNSSNNNNNNTLNLSNKKVERLKTPVEATTSRKSKDEEDNEHEEIQPTRRNRPPKLAHLLSTGSASISQTDSFDSTSEIEDFKADDEEPITAYTGLCKLCFSVTFDPIKEVLTVHLIRGVYFSLRNSIPHLFVKLHLLPDKKRKHHSRAHKSCSPEFNEVFTFPLLQSALHTQVLEFTVLTHDRFHLSHQIGHVHYPLADHVNSTEQIGGTGHIWRGIEEDSSTPVEHKGEICVLMSYFPNTNYITVTLMEGRGIQVDDNHADIAIKVSLVHDGKLIKMKKSTSDSQDLNAPTFNETFVFDVQQETINHICFIFAVCLYPHRGSKTVLGRVIIGPVMYASGQGLDHWSEVHKHPQQTFRRWHEIV